MKVMYISSLDESLKTDLKAALEDGNIIGIATDTIFGLAFDRNNESALERIINIKQRENLLFTYHIGDISQLMESHIKFDRKIIEYIKEYLPGPVTFIIPGEYCGEKEYFGIRFPKNRLAREFFSIKKFPSLVATSCNISDNPSLTKEDDIIEFLEGKVDYILFDKNYNEGNISSTIIKIEEDYTMTLVREGELPFEHFKKIN